MSKTIKLLKKYGLRDKEIKKISPHIKNLKEHIEIDIPKYFGDHVSLYLSITYKYDNIEYNISFDKDYSGNCLSWIPIDGPDFETETDLHYILLERLCYFLDDNYTS